MHLSLSSFVTIHAVTEVEAYYAFLVVFLFLGHFASLFDTWIANFCLAFFALKKKNILHVDSTWVAFNLLFWGKSFLHLFRFLQFFLNTNTNLPTIWHFRFLPLQQRWWFFCQLISLINRHSFFIVDQTDFSSSKILFNSIRISE